MTRKSTFRVKVLSVRSGRPSGFMRWWFRVNIHPSREAMYRHIDNSGKPHSHDYNAMCSMPSRRERRKDGCLGEVNFYYPNISPSLAAHEFVHATVNALAFCGHRALVPPKFFPNGHFSDSDPWVKGKITWSNRQERAAYMLGSFMAQFHDECVKRNLWNK